MILPKLPYRFKKASQDIIEFRGLNKTENYKDGNLRDSIGLSTAEYPTLTQSKPFVAEGQSDITDMYEHNGKILTVGADGKLVFDGQYIGNIKPGRKQFATVNTRLCIFPDKVYIDLNNMKLFPLSVGISAPNIKGSVTVTDKSINIQSGMAYLKGQQASFRDYYFSVQHYYYTYTYGTSREDVAECWDNENKLWRNLKEKEKATKLVDWSNADKKLDYLGEGYIFIPDDSGGIISGKFVAANAGGTDIDISKYNKDGIYCVVTAVDTEEDYVGDTDLYYITRIYTYDAYRAEDNKKLFSDTFSTGSIVDVKGTPAALYDGTAIKVESISDDGQTIVFAENTFSGAESYLELTEDISGEKIIKADFLFSDDGNEDTLSLYFKVNIFDTVKAGKVLYFSTYYGNVYLYVWDPNKQKTVANYEAEAILGSDYDINLNAYDVGTEITVSKHIPDLDYICESENRLWGVSNRTHTIYASALGLPGEFTEFDVVSTDSYAVAVASEDDFTAICAYGGGVCCFKENRLHKILGSFPAQYYMNEYEIAGVQKGSERSLQIIDEVLYYKGKYGVYAYSGGVPKLVSYELGNIESAAKASVADGLNYYISLGDGVYVYDKLHGLWMKQTDLTCNAMITDGQLIYGLSNGAMFVNSGNVATTKWSAEFTPFDMQGFFKKGFAKLMISAEMGKGALLSVYIREDKQPWRKVYNQAATNNMLLSVPLRVGRCDRFSVKIEGKGIVKLRGISRDVIVGSER